MLEDHPRMSDEDYIKLGKRYRALIESLLEANSEILDQIKDLPPEEKEAAREAIMPFILRMQEEVLKIGMDEELSELLKGE